MYLLRNTPEVDPGIEKKQLEKDNYHESVSTLYDESKKDLKEAEDPRTAVENESRQDQDSNTIWWDSDDDPENPMNWSSANKWANLGIISIITFIMYGRSVALKKHTFRFAFLTLRQTSGFLYARTRRRTGGGRVPCHK